MAHGELDREPRGTPCQDLRCQALLWQEHGLHPKHPKMHIEIDGIPAAELWKESLFGRTGPLIMPRPPAVPAAGTLSGWRSNPSMYPKRGSSQEQKRPATSGSLCNEKSNHIRLRSRTRTTAVRQMGVFFSSSLTCLDQTRTGTIIVARDIAHAKMQDADRGCPFRSRGR